MKEAPLAVILEPMDADRTRGFEDLVGQAKNGDRTAMDRMLESLRPYLVNVARKYADPLRPEESTSDLLQEGSLRAWQKLDTFQGGSGDEQNFEMFRVWAGQIVRRLGLNARRDRRRMVRSPGQKILPLDRGKRGGATTGHGAIDPTDRELTPAARAESRERARQIREAVERLPEGPEATIVRKHLVDGATFMEISKEIGVEYNKVRRLYHATLRRLEEDLGDLL